MALYWSVRYCLDCTGEPSLARGTFDHRGGELFIKRYGFRLVIPHGALEKDDRQEISLSVLTEVPDDLILLRSDMLTSFGFRGYPSGLVFKKPVTITMPHCAVLRRPKKVRAVLYFKANGDIGKDNALAIITLYFTFFSGGFRGGRHSPPPPFPTPLKYDLLCACVFYSSLFIYLFKHIYTG